MIKKHLASHGQTYWQHFKNNWYFTRLALKAACYTMGHGLTPLVSGQKATELHNELWSEGRKLSLTDLRYRLATNYYVNKNEAVKDYESYCSLYNEQPLLIPFIETINKHYSK